MNQAELISDVAEATGLPKKAVGDVLNALGSAVAGALALGNEAPLPGLGKLVPERVEAREGRNPSTGEPLHIPAKTVAKFRAAKALKDALNP